METCYSQTGTDDSVIWHVHVHNQGCRHAQHNNTYNIAMATVVTQMHVIFTYIVCLVSFVFVSG